jgi:excisionase family DNA binding protein
MVYESARVISVKIPEAVRITGISRSRLYELIRNGDLEIVKIGRATLIKTASLEALIERLTKDIEGA